MSIISRTRVILKTDKAKPDGFATLLRDGELTVAPETHFLGFGETHIGRVLALHLRKNYSRKESPSHDSRTTMGTH